MFPGRHKTFSQEPLKGHWALRAEQAQNVCFSVWDLVIPLPNFKQWSSPTEIKTFTLLACSHHPFTLWRNPFLVWGHSVTFKKCKNWTQDLRSGLTSTQYRGWSLPLSCWPHCGWHEPGHYEKPKSSAIFHDVEKFWWSCYREGSKDQHLKDWSVQKELDGDSTLSTHWKSWCCLRETISSWRRSNGINTLKSKNILTVNWKYNKIFIMCS